MEDDKVRVAFLAGYNRGKAAKQEEKEKTLMERKGSNHMLRGYKILTKTTPSSTVLEDTLDSVVDNDHVDIDNSFLIGGKDEIETTCEKIPLTVYEQGSSLEENIFDAVSRLYADGYEGDAVITCADLSAMRREDINDFIDASRARDLDFIAGLGVVEELKDYILSHEELADVGKISKFGIRFLDDMDFSEYERPLIHFGNTFYFNKDVADRKERLREAIGPMLGMKKLFRNPDNLYHIAKILKDEDVPDERLPRTEYPLLDKIASYRGNLASRGISTASEYVRGTMQMLSTISFANRYSDVMNRMKKTNLAPYKWFAKDDDFLKTSELEKEIDDRIFNGDISFGITKVHPRVVSDVDDYTDLERNRLIKQKGY